jgi:hypothetical protein
MQGVRGTDGFSEFFGSREIDVRDPDEGAGPHEFLDGSFANAAGTACDKSVAAFKMECLR